MIDLVITLVVVFFVAPVVLWLVALPFVFVLAILEEAGAAISKAIKRYDFEITPRRDDDGVSLAERFGRWVRKIARG